MRNSIIREGLVPGMKLEDVIAWAKKNPDEMMKTDIGRAVMALIKKGDLKKLRRYWLGKR